jgi:modulator of FtsH protease HflK
MPEQDVTPGRGPQLQLSPKLIIVAVIVIAIAASVMSSFFVVDQSEEAVVIRLGKVNRIVGPGLQFKFPFGIEQNYNVPTQIVQKMEFGFRTEAAGVDTRYSSADYPEESIMLTGDLNIIDTEWIIQFRISNPRDWLFKVRDQYQTIRDISQSAINQLVGDRAILDVIGSERSNIEVEAQKIMQKKYDQYELGITVTTVKLQNVVPPKGEVQDAFEDVNKAVQDMNRFINEGKEEYNQQIPRARGQAQQVVQEAQGYASERVNRANGDVARFRSVATEYQKSPEITRQRLYIEMIEAAFADMEGTDLIDRNLDNFIPLKSLQQAGGQQ